MYVSTKDARGASNVPGRLEDVNVYDAMAGRHASKYCINNMSYSMATTGSSLFSVGVGGKSNSGACWIPTGRILLLLRK